MRQNRLRIAHVRWGEPFGGTERAIRDLAVHIDQSHFDLAFFFLTCGGPYVAELLASGYPVFIIPARSGYNIRRIISKSRGKRRINWAIPKTQIIR